MGWGSPVATQLVCHPMFAFMCTFHVLVQVWGGDGKGKKKEGKKKETGCVPAIWRSLRRGSSQMVTMAPALSFCMSLCLYCVCRHRESEKKREKKITGHAPVK